MSLYESVIIARQDISAAQVETLVDQLTAVLSEGGAEVKKKEMWGLRNLAYRVQKNRKGHYVLLNIDGPSTAVDEYERQMRINEDVLRYMTVRVEEHEEGPSAMMQPRNERGDRGGRGGRRGDRKDQAEGEN